MTNIKSFTQLTTWKEAHKLVLMVYKCTKNFPENEKFGLINQCRRAVVSITSNIAEGFGRKSAKDKRNFYIISKTSLAELQNQMLICKDLGYLNRELFNLFTKQSIVVDKLLSGLYKSAVDKGSSGQSPKVFLELASSRQTRLRSYCPVAELRGINLCYDIARTP